MAFSQTHFQNAQNVVVNNGQFINIANNPPSNDPVLSVLWPHVAAGAIFDSAERHSAGKCHPGTRKKIIEQINSWIAHPNSPQSILWLYGPAGAGKSAIAHTICDLLKQQHPDRYVGSFFFLNRSIDRGTALKLFTTLSYQLAIHSPPIRANINDALFHDPSLPTKSMEIQFLSLIIQPLLQSQSLLSCTPILIIDGLDECGDDEGMDTQRHIIAWIAQFIIKYNLPLRVMITSRPEYWIRDAFDTAPLPSITKPLCLRDDRDAHKDIQAYLIDEFEKIRVENKRVMGSVVPPWPPTKIVKRFVEEASGQYVYASTVLKFVGKFSRFSNPQKQLDIITSPGPHRASAFSELDRLYASILSAYPQWETMKRVLEGLLIGANRTIITAVLGVSPDDLVLVLDALSSLVDIPEPIVLFNDDLVLESIFGPLIAPQDRIYFCHLSFCEFLESQTRSGTFHIDLGMIPNEVIKAFMDMIHRNIDQRYQIEPHLLANIDHFTYHCLMPIITYNCIIAGSRIGTLVPLVSKMTEKLVPFDPGNSLDSLLCFTRDLDILQALFCVEPHQLGEETENTIEFTTVCKKLKKAVSLARRRAMVALSLCSTFKVTSTLVYLAECYRAEDLSIHELSLVPGVNDVISTIKEHRHFLRVAGHSLYSMNTNALPGNIRGTSSRIQTEWKDMVLFLADSLLKRILSLEFGIARNAFICCRFFDSREYSDIRTQEYFQNPLNVSILTRMADLDAWTGLVCSHWFTPAGQSVNLDEFTSILSWYYRQLTNLQTLKLLQDYNPSLEQTMTTIMELIFEHKCLPALSESYKKELWAFEDNHAPDKPRSIKIKVLPLPQGFHQETEDSWIANEGTAADFCQVFHNKLYGTGMGAGGLKEGSQSSVIDSWARHHLVSRLLNTLIRFLFGRIYETFSTAKRKYEKSFPLITQYLPYAKPTLQNLDALRAIVYLYPQVTPPWQPPEGFWHSAAEFLQKYDHSVLSSEELDLFMSWLQSTDHADITTYTT